MLQHLSDKLIDRLLYFAIAAAFVGACADVLLLYSPKGGYENGTYEFYLSISSNRLLLGHYLGIVFIPFELLGLFFLYRGLSKGNEKTALFLILATIYTVFPGLVYHGTCAMTGTLVQLGEANPDLDVSMTFEYWKLLFEPLGAMLAVGLLVMSVFLVYIIRFKNTQFTKWLAWASPLTFYIIFLVFYFALPVIGNVLIPAGFNLSFFLFFVCAKLAYHPAK